MTSPSSETPAAPSDAALVPPESSAVALIREAIINKADPAQLRELVAVRREWEGDEARKAYNAAISEFQRRAPIVEKGDEANGKQYARIDRIWREVRPLLTELGLSVTWQITELRGWDATANTSGGSSAICHIEGTLRHKLGHGEKLVFDLPLPKRITTSDGRDVQNAAQQMGSANTYAKRYALCAALGIVTGDDDDGNGAGAGDLTVTKAQEKEIKDLLDAARGLAGFDEKKFWAWVGCGKIGEIYKRQVPAVIESLKKKLKGGS